MRSVRLVDRLALRLGLAAALVTAAVFVSTGLVLVRSESRALTAELTRRILAETRGLALAVSSPLLRHDPELGLHPLILRTLEELPVVEDLIVVDAEGVIQGHEELRRIGERWAPAASKQRLHVPGMRPDHEVYRDGSSLLVSQPILHLDQPIGTLIVRASQADTQRAVAASVRRVGLIATAGTLLAILLVASLVARSLRSLGALRAGVERIGSGRLDTRIDVRGRDEFALLAEHINEMADNLSQAQNELVEKERIDHELKLARELQAMLLPRELPVPEGYELAAHYEAALEVGGDYYDVLPLSDGSLLLVAADVSGKGVPGLVLMAMLRVIVRGFGQPGRSPESILETANRMLEGSMRRGMFITCWLGILAPQTHRLRFTSAGHCAPLLLAAEGTRWLPARGKPLGMFDGETFRQSLTVHECHLETGDALVLYTDGWVEAQNARGDQLGADAMVSACASRAPASELLSRLRVRVDEHRQGVAASDDLTLVVLRRLPVGAALPSKPQPEFAA